jgi:hypothetical protein
MRKLVTFEDLRVALIESALDSGLLVPPTVGNIADEDQIWAPTDQNVLWFVALLEAKRHREDSLKDQAQLFLHGLEPITKESVPNWLAQFYDDDDPKEWSDLRNDMDDFFRS